MNGIAYINANLPAPQTVFTGADGRPRWTPNNNKLYANVIDAIVLTNQGRGYSWSAAASLERAFQSGWFAKVGYSYGASRNTVDAGSIATGSWSGNQIVIDPNNPVAANSQFYPGGRIFGAVSYTRDFFGVGPTSVSVYFDGHSGGTDSYIFSNDMNGDGVTNDLIYIPRNIGEMNFATLTVTSGTNTQTFTPAQQVAAWEAYINQDPYLRNHRGEYAGRNAALRPWYYRADLSFSQDVSRRIGGQPNSLQVRLDFLNFTNFLKSDWGVSQTLVTSRPLASAGVDASGASRYTLATLGSAPNAVLICHAGLSAKCGSDLEDLSEGRHHGGRLADATRRALHVQLVDSDGRTADAGQTVGAQHAAPLRRFSGQKSPTAARAARAARATDTPARPSG